MLALTLRHTDQANQATAKQPHRSGRRHRADIARLNSPRIQTTALTADSLVAIAHIEEPREVSIRRVLRSRPIEVGLNVKGSSRLLHNTHSFRLFSCLDRNKLNTKMPFITS